MIEKFYQLCHRHDRYYDPQVVDHCPLCTDAEMEAEEQKADAVRDERWCDEQDRKGWVDVA